MRRIETALEGVYILEPRVFEDRRGFFFESYNDRALAELGITDRFVQDNHSRSCRGTLRGLHYQTPPGQSKLVRVVVGEVWDVAVDVRFGSPTFGQHVAVVLSAENKRQFYIPAGFAHGFCVLSESADFLYKVNGYYAPNDERGVLWNDPELAVPWPIADPILSDKDKVLPSLRDIARDYVWRGPSGSSPGA
ncbi:MAG: dTDP-4-dehydrorhamnose 3,5-epimerase [Chloroflexi bacterium]|nr:dTDP-4-dehydrorhamnose 3,5-epimerase [Chloroflexota bacterium]